MRGLLCMLALVAACSKSSPATVDQTVDWRACDTALRQTIVPIASGQNTATLLGGCHVCGDWSPIVDWNKPQTSGGPKRADIEAAMLRCNAFCSGDAKLKFLGTLDDARGTSSRTPWRQLGEICKDAVSAVPDQRFMSGPYFALDRIARAVFAHGGQTAKLAEQVIIPLPLLSVVGTGIGLPTARGVIPSLPRALITFVAGDIYVGESPTAQLTAGGIRVSEAATSFPGKKVTLAELPAELERLRREKNVTIVALIASPGTLAQALLPIISAAGPIVHVYLGAEMEGGYVGWKIPGVIMVQLDTAFPTDKVDASTTVQQLATILSAL